MQNAKLKEAFSRVYFLIFQNKPGEISSHLFKNIFYNVGGTVGGTLITFVFSAWAIRLMGPAEYGNANIVISIAAFLTAFMLFGLINSAMRYLARERESRGEILGSILLNALVFFTATAALFWAGQPIIAELSEIPPNLLDWAVIYAVIISASSIAYAILRGLDEFKKQALLTIISAVFFSGWILFSAIALQDFTADQYLIASALRWLAFALMAAIIILPLVKKPSLRWMSETFRFGTYHFWMYLAGFFLFFSMDILMINHYLGAAAAGIYGAYYMAFNVIAGKFFNSIIEALYPMASTIDDVKTMLTRIVQLSKWLVLPIFISGILLNAVLFQFYGREFPFQWNLAALMSLIIVLYAVSGLMTSIIGSRGISGARFLLATFALGAVANVGLKIIVIPEWELAGAMLVTVFIFALMLGTYWRWLRAEADKISS